MLREARIEDSTRGRRSTPSLTRTVQTLRRMSGRTSRTPLEARIIAIRHEKQLV